MSKRFVVPMALSLVLASCGGIGAGVETTVATNPVSPPSSPPDSTPATTGETTATTTGEGGAVSSLQEVESATVRIVAEGTFMDPEFGEIQNAAGSGSGFIIDESGIAVTNNHVATGAAFLEVWLEGEEDPRNAKVLGVSECSDLAVIDIDGDGFPFLEWYGEDIDVGLEIFVAGFPLGSEEYTLLDGVVSKADADGETSWSSVDAVIEHSADTLPGNSGGPVVTTDGQVVAVNYAGDSAGQSFAIGRDVALPVIETLQDDEDVHSIGVNGTAVAAEDFTGIWVASVETGSPAHEVGIEAGDIITRLEGLLMSVDGTMADYCDVLRSNAAEDEMTVEVLRFSSSEIWEGTLNGPALELATSFASELSEEAPDASPTDTYETYVDVSDDTGALTLQVPAEWGDQSGVAWEIEGESVGVSIVAAPDIQGWYDTWDVPGVFFGASRSLADQHDVASLLDSSDFSGECTLDSRNDYSDPLYTGQYDLWTDCGGVGTTFVVLAAEPEDGSYLMLVQVAAVTDADFDALDTILNTFVASGDF